jgi:hypothetical protein
MNQLPTRKTASSGVLSHQAGDVAVPLDLGVTEAVGPRSEVAHDTVEPSLICGFVILQECPRA